MYINASGYWRAIEYLKNLSSIGKNFYSELPEYIGTGIEKALKSKVFVASVNLH
jgi:hypothetical protein